jgi:hypothetical protein
VAALAEEFPWLQLLPLAELPQFVSDFTRAAQISAEIGQWPVLAETVREWKATAAVSATAVRRRGSTECVLACDRFLAPAGHVGGGRQPHRESAVAEHLKNLFDRALDDEPAFPDGDYARQAMDRGRGIRRRRGLLVGGSTAAVVVAVAAALNLAPAPAGPPPQVSAAALALVAQKEPRCNWPVSRDATDVYIFLRHDATGPQRDALEDSLRTDPAVRNWRFESRQEAYETFKVLWRDSPDFVASIRPESLPESFRLNVTRAQEYSGFAARYAGRPGVQDLVGGVCP